MTKKRQFRRSISVMGRTYRRLVAHAIATQQSVSGYLERLVKADLDAKGVPLDPGPQPMRTKGPNPMPIEEPEAATGVVCW